MKNGFTLIELLAVIIILSIILLITIMSVDSVLFNSKNELSELQQKNIEEAAEAYYIKEGMSKDAICVNLSYLTEKGYLERDVVLDPKTKEEFLGSVKISYEANHYSYEYQEKTCE